MQGKEGLTRPFLPSAREGFGGMSKRSVASRESKSLPLLRFYVAPPALSRKTLKMRMSGFPVYRLKERGGLNGASKLRSQGLNSSM